MNLENTMLRETARYERTSIGWSHSNEVPAVEVHRDRKQNSGFQGLAGAMGDDDGSYRLRSTEVQFGKTEKLWGWMLVMVAPQCEGT